MAKQIKTPQSAGTLPKKGAKPRVNGSQPHTVAATNVKHAVTPTSERIIRQTSVKRRRAMKVLANR